MNGRLTNMCDCIHNCCEYEEPKEITPEERYVKRLGYRKVELRQLQKYLNDARKQLWPEIRACNMTPQANLLITCEILERYLRQQLNWELKEKGLEPVRK